jgi:hypothetical protein
MREKKRFSRGNLIFLFVVAFLVGAIAKRVINNHVRTGFNDPETIIDYGTLYDIDHAEQAVLQEDSDPATVTE